MDPPEGGDLQSSLKFLSLKKWPSCLTTAGTSLYERQHRGLSQSHRPISNIILPRSWTLIGKEGDYTPEGNGRLRQHLLPGVRGVPTGLDPEGASSRGAYLKTRQGRICWFGATFFEYGTEHPSRAPRSWCKLIIKVVAHLFLLFLFYSLHEEILCVSILCLGMLCFIFIFQRWWCY